MLQYLIYLIAFVLGAILGLVYSYKVHSEPYVVQGLDIISLVIAILGWTLIFNFRWFIILASVGFFLAGYVLDQRPGYGRKETVIGIIVGLLIYLIRSLI